MIWSSSQPAAESEELLRLWTLSSLKASTTALAMSSTFSLSGHSALTRISVVLPTGVTFTIACRDEATALVSRNSSQRPSFSAAACRTDLLLMSSACVM